LTLNMALGNVSRTVAITSIASSFGNRYPILPDPSLRLFYRAKCPAQLRSLKPVARSL
jgi:hypothetical protein